MHFFIDTFIFLLIVVDPLALIPIFIALTRQETDAQRLKIALRTCVISFLLFVLFAFLGEAFLDVLGITTPALQIAGGILLFKIAIEMLHSGVKVEDEENTAMHTDIAIFPLAIPLIAGPGALTGVVMKMREISDEPLLQASVLLAILTITLLSYGCLYFAIPIGRIIGKTGINVIIRVFGIILAALACEFVLSGVLNGLIKPYFSH